ncbi:high-affinity Zn(2+) transporter zrt1, partial [Tulasnella sp. 419]
MRTVPVENGGECQRKWVFSSHFRPLLPPSFSPLSSIDRSPMSDVVEDPHLAGGEGVGAGGGHEEEVLNCGSGNNEHTFTSLRIAAIFVILVTSSFGALFPVLAQRSRFFKVPKSIYDFAKHFGSGVIIATAFIHLLAPGFEALGSECLTGAWGDYPWPAAIAMMSVFGIFFVEIAAFRWGTEKLRAAGAKPHDVHGHALHATQHAAHGPEGVLPDDKEKQVKDITSDAEEDSHQRMVTLYSSQAAQIIGVSILEFGVIFHSFLIGLTLAVDEDFKVLFIVIVFHQMFEGLGLGSRLANIELPPSYDWARVVGAAAYGLVTPLGTAIGLGIRTTYNPGSTTASAVSGVFDSISA